MKHGADADLALKEFTDLVKNVARDLEMAEAAEKEARAAELARQMQSADNDRAMESLSSKVERIEKLTAAHAAATTSHSTARSTSSPLVTASVLESVCVASVLMRELASCRWRIRSRAKFLECLVTDIAPDKAAVADGVLTDQWPLTAPEEAAQLDKFNLQAGEAFSVSEEQQAEEKDWDQQPMSKVVAAAVEKQKVKLAELYKVPPPALCYYSQQHLISKSPPPHHPTTPPPIILRCTTRNSAAGVLQQRRNVDACARLLMRLQGDHAPTAHPGHNR